MYSCKEFYSLSVLSLYEGEFLGKVERLYFDKKLKKLLEIELIGEDESRLNLLTKNIYHVGKNAITVKNNQSISLKIEESLLYVCPINSKAYSITGEFLGVVKDISFNEKFITQKVLLDNNGALDVDNIASFGRNTIIFYGDHKTNIKKFTPKKVPKLFKNKEVQIANILPVTNVEENNQIEENFKQEEKNKKTENCLNADFLIGRICTKDIFNFNNELLIKSHTIVNKKNLKEIGRYGKLRELMLYTK